MDSAQALFQMLAWQVTNSRGYASSPTSHDQSRPFHVNSAVTGSELTHESSRPAAESRNHFWRLPQDAVTTGVKSNHVLRLSDSLSQNNAKKIYGENTVIAMPPQSWISREDPLFSWYDVTVRGFPTIADRNV